MDTGLDVPEGIGPHEHRELELMLSGKKPMAMFSDVVPPSFEWPEANFEPHVAAGTFIKREEIYRAPDGQFPLRCVYYALPSEVWRIEKLHAINVAIFSGMRSVTDQDEIETGRLLGYSEAQVVAFVEWIHKRRLKQGGV
ncbi:MAG: hypothetical protein QF384_02965 [Alphaproteobacteria bacterium]|jgi:hypothetical protein|nr:hypothetical protein [Alphaproteobacteria bacterium]